MMLAGEKLHESCQFVWVNSPIEIIVYWNHLRELLSGCFHPWDYGIGVVGISTLCKALYVHQNCSLEHGIVGSCGGEEHSLF